ncbi:DNA primase [Psychroserpens sp.]|uniref:DNA primase n=1 Tax=Psychroserpens sp. TaxID=2020870 RepID=UPI001B26EE91|nr:DNA primase [Psychroserpens sp.]MBO6607959.1 DNA primase [Psychroserpens sp.]MBO6631117.1 DNA primase [Psychroserpens sp.]MBO6654914.1 DNA primase [Psychroserpens sp.]MBO6683012.1 DNA primase [Psychroserpens sp.]MBO6751317.1 DNA primase [Psychroserpens sp.]
MISKSTIDQVFETARVEEVIGDFVQLKKAGSNFKGLSPFSDERSPSFMVSPVKQIWKDFSSGKGGNAVTFLMEHEHFTYPEAIKYLAKKYNIEIEETEQTDEQKQAANERESLYLVNEFAKDYFERVLFKTDAGQAIGLSYFKERGFTNETIKAFNLGYCLDEWQAFTDEALKKGYLLDNLEKTGLTIVKPDKKFDRFKGRVIFPIHSMSGRVLGFGGRILTTDKKAAKYLNSPESEVYHKSKILYGIYHAKQAIAKEDNCYLVEGYTDVIQFHQTGIKNVVASSGTALTPEQIRLVNRLTKNITVLFDGDAAGIRASLRGIDLILEQGMNVKVCTFPEGEDPDSFAKQNTLEELQAYLNEASQDFIQFKASLLIAEAKNDPIKKAETIRDIVNSISKIPDQIKKEIYIQECSRIMDISEDVLFSTLAQINKKDIQEAAKTYKAQQKSFEVVKAEKEAKKVDLQYELERKIIEILLLYGTESEDFEDLVLKETEDGDLDLEPVIHKAKVFEKIYLDLQEDEMQFSNPNFKSLYYTIIDTLHQEPDFSTKNFVNKLDPELASDVTTILMNDERYRLHDWQRNNIIPKDKKHSIAQLVTQTILTLRCYLIDKKVAEYQNDTLQADSNTRSILEDVKDYVGLKMLLSRKLGKVVSG